MSSRDEFDLEDILNEIGAPDVDRGKVVVKQSIRSGEKDLFEAKKKGKTILQNEEQGKPGDAKKKHNPRSKERDDKHYATTVVNRKLVKLIMVIYPELYIRDAVEEVLKDWVMRNKKEIRKNMEEDLKI